MAHDRIEPAILQTFLEQDGRLVQFGLNAMSLDELRQFDAQLRVLRQCVQDQMSRRVMQSHAGAQP